MTTFSTCIKILLIDDSIVMRRTITSALKDLDINETDNAESGASAMYKLKNEHYTLVLLDWNMRGVSGLDVLKALRADNTLKNIPIIMIASETTRDNTLAAARAGANNFLSSPFTFDKLKKAIEEVLSN